MDFSNFKSVKSANVRKGGTFTKEQSYEDLKYRRVERKDGSVEGRFYISTSRWSEWGLEGAKGLKQFTGPNGETVLALVAEAEAVMVKGKENGKEKGKNFKSVRLEASLEANKVINTTLAKNPEGKFPNQYLKLTEVAKGIEIDSVKCELVYTLSAGTKKESKDTVATPPAGDQNQAAPVVAPAPQAASADAGWN